MNRVESDWKKKKKNSTNWRRFRAFGFVCWQNKRCILIFEYKWLINRSRPDGKGEMVSKFACQLIWTPKQNCKRIFLCVSRFVIVADVGDFKAIKSDENINTASGYLLLKFFFCCLKKRPILSRSLTTQKIQNLCIWYTEIVWRKGVIARKSTN